MIKRIKAENGFKEYPENLKELLTAIDSSYYAREWSAEKVADMNKKVFQLRDKNLRNMILHNFSSRDKRGEEPPTWIYSFMISIVII